MYVCLCVRESVGMCEHVHKHIYVWENVLQIIISLTFFACWQMNNLKKILQKVVDYYSEVGCSRLSEGLFTFGCLNGTIPFYCVC